MIGMSWFDGNVWGRVREVLFFDERGYLMEKGKGERGRKGKGERGRTVSFFGLGESIELALTFVSWSRKDSMFKCRMGLDSGVV